MGEIVGNDGVKVKIGANDAVFKKFDPEKEMYGNPSICMVAKRGSGKSWIIRDLLHHLSDVPAGIIICPTERMNRFYGEFFPESFIFNDFQESTIEKLMARQVKMIDKAEEKQKRGKHLDARAVCVMDDCLADGKKWKNAKPILDMFYNGRHYHITYILTVQYSVSIGPNLRCNFDLVFLLKEDFISNRRRLHEHFVGMIGDFNAFCNIFDKMTSDFKCMVINLRSSSSNPLDKIAWYKARHPNEIKPVQIGCDQFNKFNRKNYEPKWRTKNGLYTNVDSKIGNKKSTSVFNTKLI